MFTLYAHCCRQLCGSLGCYDIGMEKRVSLRNPIELQTYNKVFHKVTTTDDPVIRKVSKVILFIVVDFVFLFSLSPFCGYMQYIIVFILIKAPLLLLPGLVSFYEACHKHDFVAYYVAWRLYSVVPTYHTCFCHPSQLVKSPECADVKVFGTDAILSTLMTCSRSKYSWDIVATRVGENHLFFDKRDDSRFGKKYYIMRCVWLNYVVCVTDW